MKWGISRSCGVSEYTGKVLLRQFQREPKSLKKKGSVQRVKTGKACMGPRQENRLPGEALPTVGRGEARTVI